MAKVKHSSRVLIRKSVAKLISANFKGVFRKVTSGGWRPGAKSRPRCTVVEEGQRSDSGPGGLCEQEASLVIKVVLDLDEAWDREETYDEWADRVQAIIDLVSQGITVGASQYRMNYVNDDPLDVILQSGATESIWIIEFEAQYLLGTDFRTL